MIPTTDTKINEGDRSLTRLESNTLKSWLKTEDVPDGVSRCDVLRELENRKIATTQNNESDAETPKFQSLVDYRIDFSNYSDGFDLLLSTSSLTEGSDFSFGSDDDLEDGDMHLFGNSSANHEEKESVDDEMIGQISSQKLQGTTKVGYVNLFFDKKTQELLTLWIQQDDGSRKGALHHSAPLILEDSNNYRVQGETTTRKNKEEYVDFAFHDDTLLTECSSISSETSGNDDEDWAFHDIDFNHAFSCVPAKTRYPEEPIVFSNDESMYRDLYWLEKTEIDLYLLNECDDVWDYDESKGTRCTDSLKKLLLASRLCISLPQTGESKWKASTNLNDSYSCPSRGNGSKVKLERASYSVLKD